ncbi:sn-glycerol-3-phosphate ABC transporter ATP-binding protein UgpC [Devosia sp. XJ19-1]|uniref:Sn-glycerol-3-phosphate ABC transporter ATP-binding protein UgpC n=1 Tax=Devosia ureilytica TaxID=2952754 RepID=A0A9Q4FUY7_9HYPH|nr:sn-glycerol-3-phosphate ABC transporter ATP-binding protein UgpC [Devosia ureilytica]MCP8885172.1 sn-glycerol-3-phosphate ABC transporter ATP-binding protein UgpC [Devosia ureilytica]MCP8888894.1 sn-glycerol-3-phosphate ABC transporter ATP-binding protein UgpC [Devosia ureilytica]
MAELQLRGINKSFGAVKVIHDIDLDIANGEFVVFVGPSGCGKSTLLRTISGLEEPSSGQVLIGGEDVTDFDPSERGVAMVFQSYALYPHMTVEQNLGFGLRMGGMPREQVSERVLEAARVLELTDLLERKPRQLSGGQRQRVAIGRAIVRQPKAFLFDEPLSNLDAELRVQMRIEIAKLHQQLGSTMVYVTHDQVEAMTLADRIVVLRAGRIEQQGSPIELYDNPDNRFVAGFIGSPRMNFLDGVIESINGADMTVKLDAFDASGLVIRRRGVTAAVGQKVSVGIRPEHFSEAAGDGPVLTAKAQVVEQLGGVSYVYAVGKDDQTKVTIQQKGHSRIADGAAITVGFEPGALLAFDESGLRI